MKFEIKKTEWLVKALFILIILFLIADFYNKKLG